MGSEALRTVTEDKARPLRELKVQQRAALHRLLQADEGKSFRTHSLQERQQMGWRNLVDIEVPVAGCRHTFEFI